MAIIKKLTQALKYTFGFPYYLHRLHTSVEKLAEQMKEDHNLFFKYLTRGIDLHPYSKRESDVLVSDYRRAPRSALLRYEFAATHLPCGGDFLDLSCGYGYGTRLLLEKCAANSIVGADLCKPSVIFAKRVFSEPNRNILFRCCDGTDPQAFPAHSFDGIVSLETLEHVLDASALVNNFKRWLRPNLILVLSAPNEEIIPFEADDERYQYHVKHYSVQEIRNLASQCGLAVVKELYLGGAEYSQTPSSHILAVLTHEK